MENEVAADTVQARLYRWSSLARKLVAQDDAEAIKWTRCDRIIAIVSQIASERSWTLLPGGMGVEIARACPSSEPECIQIESRDGQLYVCKPASLTCIFLQDYPDQSCFRLRLRRLKPIDETIVGRDPTEEWHGKVRAADGTERRDDYTRLLRGRLQIVARDVLDANYEGQYEELIRNQLLTQLNVDSR
jgi:hypothetical protein